MVFGLVFGIKLPVYGARQALGRTHPRAFIVLNRINMLVENFHKFMNKAKSLCDGHTQALVFLLRSETERTSN